MTQEPAQIEEQDESVRDVFTRLYADGRAYAEAEVERQKLRAGIVGAGVRDAAILATAAITLIFAAIVAGLVGLILALAPYLGTGWATGAVFGGALIIALLLLLIARGRIDRMKKALKA
ncbi:phage holin family protein [Sphingobium sp. JS3065]|uniref:phage holin family protein n=1 Tax=Sphingobium sp. JS3065 TaxID=2970925 RepID=UPI00226475B6|nr:phage holin family protein [Sphingobium sp. JS3065]UZW56541.1 phage holin family protein [Sphingobium sp. JS3065]